MTSIALEERLGARLRRAARHLYDAECALHDAHQSHVDAWIFAASERLHAAVTDYLAAKADADAWADQVA